MKKINLLKRFREAKDEAKMERFWNHISRQIAPSLIEEKRNSVVIDEHIIAKSMVVGVPQADIEGYPTGMNPNVINEILDLSTQRCTIMYSFAISAISPKQATKMLEDAEFKNISNQKISQKQNSLGVIPTSLLIDHEDLRTNFRELYRHRQNMFNSSLIITMFGSDVDEITKTMSYVESVLNRNNILYEVPLYRMLDTFVSSMPFPHMADWTEVQCFSDHAAKLAATRNPNSRTDDRGMLFGIDKKTRKPIMIDIDALAAQHTLMVGATGSGKTFTLLLLLMRAYHLLDRRVILLEPKKDATTNYRAVVDSIDDATIIDVGPHGHNINPLEIMYDESIIDDPLEYEQAYYTHKEHVIQFFRVWFQGTMTINMEEYLAKTLTKAYKSKGIDVKNSETWKNADWPTIEYLREIWRHDAEKKGRKGVTAEAMLNKTYQFSDGEILHYMNKPSNIDLSSDFILIDMSDVPSIVQDAMNVFVTGIMGMRFRTDATKGTIIAVDEGRVYLNDAMLLNSLMRTLTQGRSHRVSLWITTLQPADLTKNNVAEEFMTNTHVNIILGNNMKQRTVKYVADFFNLNDAEKENLYSSVVGEGILIIGDQKIPIVFKPTDHEYAIIKNMPKPSTDGGVEIVDYAKGIAEKHGFVLQDWILSGEHLLQNDGHIAVKVQRAIEKGSARAYIDKKITNGDKVLNQSIDHYSTVVQIAAYLKQCGIDSEINHFGDVDVAVGDKIAFEYERPGTHTEADLVLKMQKAQHRYEKVFFVCSSGNESEVKNAIGSDRTVKRGIDLKHTIDALNEGGF